MSFIEINNIWQEYGAHVVLERLNLRVNAGEFCSMVGASGCGKSTFLRPCCGARKRRVAAPFCLMASRCRLSRTAAVAWSSSVTPSFPI